MPPDMPTKNYKAITWLAKLKYRRYPKFIEALSNIQNCYNQELADIEQMQREGKIFVIRPSRHIKIGHTEKNRKILKTVYQMGRADAVKSLPQMQAFLQE